MPDHTRITTTAELEALPIGSVVLDLGPDRAEADGPVVACKAARGDWSVMGGDPERRWWSYEIAEVARQNVLIVVYQPEGDTDA